MAYVVKKEDLISDIIQKCPRAIELMTDYGLTCANCFLNQFDTIEGGAKLHGMTDAEMEKMLNEINSELKKEK